MTLRSSTSTRAGIALLVSLLTTAAALCADKISGPLPAGGSGVMRFTVNPAGTMVAFTADLDADGDSNFELYVSPTDGSAAPVLIDEAAVQVLPMRFSPDGARLVYKADPDGNGRHELFSIPAGGGARAQLSGDLVVGGEVIEFWFSPDSSRVVYLADEDTDQVRELYSVAITGGGGVKLHPSLPGNRDVEFTYKTLPQITPDSSRVVFASDLRLDAALEIYSTPIDGGAATRLNPIWPSNRDVDWFKISPAGDSVIYTADQNTDTVREIFSVPITGGSTTRLNQDFTGEGGVFGEFQITPDSSRVVYLARLGDVDKRELFSAATSSVGIPVRLSPDLDEDEDASEAFAITADGSRVVFSASPRGPSAFDWFSIPPAGGVPIQLNPPVPPGGNISLGALNLSPDSKRLVFQGRLDRGGFGFDLYSVPIAGGPAARLNLPIPPDDHAGGAFAVAHRISPDNRWVVFGVDGFDAISDFTELFAVPLGCGPEFRLDATSVPGGRILANFMEVTGDGSRVLYLADVEGTGHQTLFSALLPAIPGDGPLRVTNIIQHAEDGTTELRWWPQTTEAWIDASSDLGGWTPHAGPVLGNCWRGQLPASDHSFARIRTQTAPAAPTPNPGDEG